MRAWLLTLAIVGLGTADLVLILGDPGGAPAAAAAIHGLAEAGVDPEAALRVVSPEPASATPIPALQGRAEPEAGPVETARIEVLILGAGDRPLANASVCIHDWESVCHQEIEHRTDACGVVRLKATRVEWLSVEVGNTHSHFMSATTIRRRARDGTDLHWTIRRPKLLTAACRFTDETTGRTVPPRAGVPVDAFGHFSAIVRLEGELMRFARKPRPPSGWYRAEHELEEVRWNGDKSHAVVEIPVVPEAVVRVIAEDEHGEPVEGIEITEVHLNDNRGKWRATTDAYGVTHIHGVPCDPSALIWVRVRHVERELDALVRGRLGPTDRDVTLLRPVMRRFEGPKTSGTIGVAGGPGGCKPRGMIRGR